MKKKIKKAFTLVELLVVIAILAILATVSIVGYNSFTKKAKVSNETALVSQINTLLKADEMVNGKANTPTDALKITSEAGYDVEKLTPTASDYDIIWNQKTNQFALLDENENVVYGEKNEGTEEYKNWKFVSEYDSATDFSVYLKGTSFAGRLEVKAGVDVGNNTEISSITYTHTSGSKQEVAIRTNGGTLNVNGINGDNGDVVNHFNDASYVDVQSIGKNSYHEYGNVGFVNIVNGRVAVEKDAKVLTAYLAETTAKVDNNSGTIENAYAKANVTNTGNVTVTEVPSGKTIEDIKNEVDEKYNAVAIVDGVYQSSLEATFTKALSIETATIEILSDINMSNISWKPIDIGYHDSGAVNTVCKNLTFNGNNHTITGLNVHVTSTNNPYGEIGAGQSNYYGEGLFGRIGSNTIVKINDITFDDARIDDSKMNVTSSAHTSQVAVVVGISSGTAILNNVNVINSYVYGGEKVSALIGHSASKNNQIIGGSVANTDITCINAQVAQAIGYVGYNTTEKYYEINKISNLKLTSNSIIVLTNTVASAKEYAIDENNNYYYNDGDWNLVNAIVAYRCMYNYDSNGDNVMITLNGKTQKLYGSDYSFTKNGDLYSLN